MTSLSSYIKLEDNEGQLNQKEMFAEFSVARIMVQSDYIWHLQNTSFLYFYYYLF